ncbi:hypothetical protein SAMN05216489_04875 [Streptomyces sp. 3213]|uniref:hypothetical protein n=1 Tax=Streptomyces sp. 3213.3 TaxID=1855348 RepID=UPI00089916AB|nr:hypothetical protein [Streptomyces sp. 3213.3]SED90893.1 hypothetical protein SAMN05216489_04875 [Streptomyces sp. 3213] [Streptomyces sp. 3213.3]
MFKKIREAVEVEAHLVRGDAAQRSAARAGTLLSIDADGTERRNEPEYSSRLFRSASRQNKK